jgi:hypothetical protein
LGLLGETFPDDGHEFLGDDETNAIGGAAAAGMVGVILEVVAVVISDLLAGLDVAHGHDPDPVVFIHDGFTVGNAGVVGEPGRVVVNVAIKVELIIEGKDVDVAGEAPLERFGLGNAFADVFGDFGSGRNEAGGKDAAPVDDGIAHQHPVLRLGGRCGRVGDGRVHANRTAECDGTAAGEASAQIETIHTEG